VSYRPICDFWMLARARLQGGVKYHGAYLGGFPERARALLGIQIDEPLLHVCGGMARLYPYRGGFGPNDKTLDLAPETKPDFLQDALSKWPVGFRAHLVDPPYDSIEAQNWFPGPDAYPTPMQLIRRSFEALPIGGRVGIIGWQAPKPPKTARFVAAIGVMCGFNNRVRIYSVFERMQ
jgi:hypothetical protein